MATSKITGARYVLAVKDLEKSAKYYQEKLGFESVWEGGGGWHFLKREAFFVMLGECQDDRSAFETNNHSYFAYIEMRQIEELYAEFLAKEVDIIAPLVDREWGTREFAIRTVDGHRIMFGEEV